MRFTLDKLIERFEDALDDHARVSQWKRETTSEAEKKRLRNRQWEIRRKMNKFSAELAKRVVNDDGRIEWPLIKRLVDLDARYR